MDNNFNNQSGNYDNNGYDNGGYDNGGYDNQGSYDNGGYDNGGYDNGGYDNGGYNNGGYDNSGYNNGGYNNGYNNQGNFNNGYYDNGGFDNGGYNPPQKSKTGLIIAVTASIVTLVSIVTILLVFLLKDKKDKKDTSETTTGTNTEFTTSATTAAVTTETLTEAITTEAPAPTPFAEEKGYTWSDPYSNLQVPAYPIAYYPDGTLLTSDLIIFDDCIATYKFSEISKSAPDANGNVTITVSYTISRPVRCTVKTNIEEEYYAWGYCRIFSYSDYYTGTQLDYGYDYVNNCWASDYRYTDITYNNQNIRIGVLATMEDNQSDYDYVGEDSIGYIYEANEERTFTIKFLVPEDYDGLVLSLVKEGYTEAWKNAESYADGTQTYNILGPDECGWTYTPDQLYFIRVNDYIR